MPGEARLGEQDGDEGRRRDHPSGADFHGFRARRCPASATAIAAAIAMFIVHLGMVALAQRCCRFSAFSRFNCKRRPHFAFAGLRPVTPPVLAGGSAFHRRDGTGCQSGGYISSNVVFLS